MGDHVRKRRLDLGLLQREVASRIGVDPITVWNWENRKAIPSLQALPKVLRFLGYDPRPEARIFSERIRQLRQGLGLSLDELAAKIGADPSTVQKWERLGYRPRPPLYARLAEVLGIPEPEKDAPFGEGLRARRLALGLTQSELAARVRVNQNTISRWELGRSRPSPGELGRIRKALTHARPNRTPSQTASEKPNQYPCWADSP